MRHAPEFVKTMRILKPLFREHPLFCVMPFRRLCDYVAYYWNRGTISYVIDDFYVPRGVCLVKLFRRLDQFLEPFAHEPCGMFCMIELMVARDPGALGLICEELTDRWGRQEIILWDRGERTENGAPRMYRWSDFQKLARRITNGQRLKWTTSSDYYAR